MVLMIGGPSHAGKTVLAQRLLELYGCPYLSLDWLKMGLIRSGYTDLTPEDDEELRELLWPIVREMIKTAVENCQDLVVEGVYFPFDWEKDFAPDYRKNIRFFCLVMTEHYIEHHFDEIKKYANAAEKRLDDSYCTKELVLADNRRALELCRKNGCEYILTDGKYEVEKEIKRRLSGWMRGGQAGASAPAVRP